ncbi:hypothetical protein HQ520_00780, partial [bacterium]|nr:hypothetical protein [bacterium]
MNHEENMQHALGLVEEAPTVHPDLMALLLSGPDAMAENDAQWSQESLRRLRREQVEKPIVYVGAGTCGLGAGAGKTLKALRECLASRQINAEVVEVGCIGLCVAEPMLDFQMPGRTRLVYRNVSAEKVGEILDAIVAGQPGRDDLIGQHRNGHLESWDSIPYLDEHSFFAPQTRWVLANCGVIDPGRIDEYIACGGYGAFARTVRGTT